MSATKSRLKTLIKASIGVALLLIVLRQVDFADLRRTLSAADYGLALVAFLLFGLSRLLEGVRLFVLGRHSNIQLWQAVEIVFVSTFFNNFTAVVVGDGYKALALSRRIDSMETAIFVIVLERLLGLAAIVGIAVYLIGANPDWLSMIVSATGSDQAEGMWRWLFAAAGMLIILLLVVYMFRHNRHVVAVLSSLKRVLRTVKPAPLIYASVLTVLAQITLAAMVFELILAFGGSIGFEQNLLVMLLVYIAAYLPISIGSLGVREGAIVYGMALFAVSQPIALAAALISRVMIYLYAIAAGIWWTVRKA